MPVSKVPRLLIIGAGPDASPLARMAGMQGWRTSVVDFRQAAIDRFDGEAESLACVDAGELASRYDLDVFDAVVLMTHNKARDRAYLAALAGSAIPYVGLLGPVSRRDRLLEEIGGLSHHASLVRALAVHTEPIRALAVDFGADGRLAIHTITTTGILPVDAAVELAGADAYHAAGIGALAPHPSPRGTLTTNSRAAPRPTV